MNIRTDNAAKYKCHTLSSAKHITVTGPMTLRIVNAKKYMCCTLSSAVHITVKLYIITSLE